MTQLVQHIRGAQLPLQQNVRSKCFQELYKMNPLEFHGDLDPLKTHDWLTSIENIFEVTPCSEEDTVVCATQMFRGPATRCNPMMDKCF